jgi:hypothetical protein
MSDINESPEIQRIVRASQVIVVAMVVGVVSFLAISVFMVPAAVTAPVDQTVAPVPALDRSQVPLLTYLALAMGSVALVMSFVVPNIFVNHARKQISTGKWLPSAAYALAHLAQSKTDQDAVMLAAIYQTQCIIGSAILEGAAFFASIAYMMERNHIALGVAGIMVGFLLSRFPLKDRVITWVEHQQERLRDERLSVA